MPIEEEKPDGAQDPIDVTPEPKVSDEEALASKIKADFEQLYGSRLSDVEKRFENFRQGSRRIESERDQLRQENARLKSQQKPSSSPEDPWTKVEDGPAWKSRIEQLAEQKAEEKLKSWQAQQQTERYVQEQASTLEASKQQVITKYPDLDPETGTTDSPVAQAYKAVLNEHPDWLVNPYGPTLAMYAMEEKLKASASNGNGPAPKSRVSLTGLTPSRPAPDTSKRQILTREQKQFCDRHNLKYEDYLKTAASVEEGVLVP